MLEQISKSNLKIVFNHDCLRQKNNILKLPNPLRRLHQETADSIYAKQSFTVIDVICIEKVTLDNGPVVKQFWNRYVTISFLKTKLLFYCLFLEYREGMVS